MLKVVFGKMRQIVGRPFRHGLSQTPTHFDDNAKKLLCVCWRGFSSSSLSSSSSSSLSASAAASNFYASNKCDEIPDFVARLVKEYASMEQTPSSLQMLMKYGRGELLGKSQGTGTASYADRIGHQLSMERILIQVACFLQQEIPIRLAYRIQDLDQIPILRDMDSVQKVKKIYLDSFLKLIDIPSVVNKNDEQKFARELQQLYEKHAGVMVMMARGAYELRAAVREGKIKGIRENKDDKELEFERMHLCHNFLDRFYISRIGIRVLAGQYLALREKPDPSYIGMIHLRTSPSIIVRKAADDAIMMCRRQYDRAPDIDITGRLDLSFPYIPTYLHYILLELLKNAVRATAERHSEEDTLPPVTVVISGGLDNEDVSIEDITIKISDEGGGIPRSQMNKIWSYLFTTADPGIQDSMIGNRDHDDQSPIAGLGYGLPIARSYTRHFGGDLDLISMENYGTDAFVYMKRLGDSKEPLPTLSNFSHHHY